MKFEKGKLYIVREYENNYIFKVKSEPNPGHIIAENAIRIDKVFGQEQILVFLHDNEMLMQLFNNSAEEVTDDYEKEKYYDLINMHTQMYNTNLGR
ncbi:hypothetical protein [Enterococcus phage VPE25]|nr:hypothetical protein [Enterococcus phage VPE25]